ncbi:glycoside hydrolase family 108 protein [Accumulibacter sp.]|uniref:glycoside hydrolase family 108 protein n=1 Tax=Accumulibacter sp. TaxID=2053492 RepID=UPI0025E49FB0|nr:glycosyl hydrolase 108 family protein [Accumulibacter sp.]MCM8594089.1 hypothetical protein [Accumulibacter sp.]MCM8624498.1 hypothetical protein [Accumulibacter sp.]MDS4048233.1 glycosyl hydrolase 108 family protein [Accumulibacter sp.]
MLPLIPLVSLAASVVPELIGLFAGQRAGEVATKVAEVVREVTGTDDPQAAAEAIKLDPAKAAELQVRLAEINQRYVELQLADAKSEREAMVATLAQQVADRTRASQTMLEALHEKDWAGRLVGLAPVGVSIVVLVGFFVFTIWLVKSPPTGDQAITLLNVLIGALVAGFTAVINFWLGSSQGSREKDRAVVALQRTQAEQAADTLKEVRAASTAQIDALIKASPATSAALAQPLPGMPSRFDLCVDLVLGKEGGFSNHPEDPGGPTMMGITQATLAAWRGHPVSADDVRTLGRTEALDIYRANYWNAMRCDDLPKGVDLMVFDFGVNAGITRSVRLLQKVAGAEQDGSIGNLTLRAVRASNPAALVEALASGRLDFYRSLDTYPTFGRGWENRVADIRKQALLMVAA